MPNDKLPRICYVLGGEDAPLEVGEEFEFDMEPYTRSKYRMGENGIREFFCGDAYSPCANETGLIDMLNHPEKIIRKPRLTFSDDEKALMRLYISAGFPWLARDDDGCLYAFKSEPERLNGIFGRNVSESDFGRAGDLFLSQITFKNSPFSAAEYLEGLKND